MSKHPVRIEALPEPHLRTKRDFLRLKDFFKKDDVAEEWFNYLTETELSLCRLHKGEPRTPELREAIGVGLGLSDELRIYVVKRSRNDAEGHENFAEAIRAAAGTLIDLCSEQRKEDGGDVALAR
jgi:hypothetical protein